MTSPAGTARWSGPAGRVLALAGIATLIACTAGTPSVPGSAGAALERRLVQITTRAGDTIDIEVELADTEQSRAIGLMSRTSLAPDSGMVLHHDEPAIVEVWMKDTTIPLSAAWFDEAGRIVWIEDLAPCDAYPCPRYAAPAPVIGVLEVNRGAFDGWEVTIGDTLEVGPPLR